MSRKSKVGNGADFSQLEQLATRIGDAVRTSQYEVSDFSPKRILKAGAYKQMEYLIQYTPKGRNGSNWYYWQFRRSGIGASFSSYYTLYGRDSKAGTLARGWVSDVPQNGAARKPSILDGIQKVDLTPIDTKGKRTLSMKFVNTAPYAGAVEYGHWVRLPYFFDGSAPGQGKITRYITGKRYTWEGIHFGQDDVQKAIANETVKQLREVVRRR